MSENGKKKSIKEVRAIVPPESFAQYEIVRRTKRPASFIMLFPNDVAKEAVKSNCHDLVSLCESSDYYALLAFYEDLVEVYGDMMSISFEDLNAIAFGKKERL
jgi:hypothetical protein